MVTTLLVVIMGSVSTFFVIFTTLVGSWIFSTLTWVIGSSFWMVTILWVLVVILFSTLAGPSTLKVSVWDFSAGNWTVSVLNWVILVIGFRMDAVVAFKASPIMWVVSLGVSKIETADSFPTTGVTSSEGRDTVPEILVFSSELLFGIIEHLT